MPRATRPSADHRALLDLDGIGPAMEADLHRLGVFGVGALARQDPEALYQRAIKLVNEAAQQYFVGNAQLLRRLETVEKALMHNAKIVVPSNAELINVISDMAGVLPLPKKEPAKA